MADGDLDKLGQQALKKELLKVVAAENLDSIPDDFSDIARFVIGCVQAAARRSDIQAMCAFVYSEDGHGSLSGALIATNRDANNGMVRSCTKAEPAAIMDEIEVLALADRCTVIWDPVERVATIYPSGINNPDDHIRNVIAASDTDITQDDVCAALDRTYNDNLCNPSGRTAKLWVKGKLVTTAEDELERHIKGQLFTFFAGHKRRVKILSQMNMTAGRADLMFLQRSEGAGPRVLGVLELKVLRGPENADRQVTEEGLAQGFHYRRDLELPFATLALFDVNEAPSNDPTSLLKDQIPEHVDIVRVKRYPLFDSPASWRKGGGYVAAA